MACSHAIKILITKDLFLHLFTWPLILKNLFIILYLFQQWLCILSILPKSKSAWKKNMQYACSCLDQLCCVTESCKDCICRVVTWPLVVFHLLTAYHALWTCHKSKERFFEGPLWNTILKVDISFSHVVDSLYFL